MNDVVSSVSEDKFPRVCLVDGAISRPDGSFELVRIKRLDVFNYSLIYLLFKISGNQHGKTQTLMVEFKVPPVVKTYTVTDRSSNPVHVFFMPSGMPVMLQATSGTLAVTRFDVLTGIIEGRLQVATEKYKMQAKFEVLAA
ncbi:hypothetical protein EJA70_11880 [Pseudomonas sp. PB103]|jgi:hypothetical protein|uniref:hypothetical protein n=1 Tax=Pseudomonas sp. PB103 TaxID=2494698 RepID=UPI00131C8F3D|nr:hypothetical protein [Pseudomonas sp. PB103]KAE9645147.1 hypothetical protein EJA70_11880 [Pseudomonas sp. PB103]